MSEPNPSTSEPEVVWTLECNGAANIITHVQTAVAAGRPVDTGFLRHQARLFDKYVAKLETGRKLHWHEHLAEETEKKALQRPQGYTTKGTP